MIDDGPPRTPPIVPQEYLFGPKVVDIGDLRVARGMTRRPVSACRHRQLVYDGQERRIWCSDCETDVEAFDAFKQIVEQFDAAAKHAERMLNEAKEARAFSIISIAAKTIDKLWRSRKHVPTCPHCNAGIWPEDAARMGMVSKEWDRARRNRAKERPADG
ncbi:hypothetical protein [Sphingopyxis sp. 113P3]|uniref:hypothetical protein n=1 Tax=Sphingopyxis sp. (strain 113P3) TaxID=292913 RepID=UPI0006AD4C35|nr:hypothetical protein [Sphingopyxis sp. 113P3]ALC13792.1 hypothetical protein LH20_17680 [Sphingopyxis sp. 113P3]